MILGQQTAWQDVHVRSEKPFLPRSFADYEIISCPREPTPQDYAMPFARILLEPPPLVADALTRSISGYAVILFPRLALSATGIP